MHAFDWRYLEERGRGGGLAGVGVGVSCLSEISFTWPEKGLHNGISKGVFSLGDGLYAIWSYKGFLVLYTSHGVSISSDMSSLSPLILSLSFFFSFFFSFSLFFLFFIYFFFFKKLYNSEKACVFRDTPAGGKAAQYCLN